RRERRRGTAAGDRCAVPLAHDRRGRAAQRYAPRANRAPDGHRVRRTEDASVRWKAVHHDERDDAMRSSALPKLIEPLDLAERREGAAMRRPPRDNVRAVQNMLAGALTDEEFYLDCVDREIEANLRRSPDRPKQAMFRKQDGTFKIQMFYWYPNK